MPEIDPLNRDNCWIDLEFVKCVRTLEPIVEVGIQLWTVYNF